MCVGICWLEILRVFNSRNINGELELNHSASEARNVCLDIIELSRTEPIRRDCTAMAQCACWVIEPSMHQGNASSRYYNDWDQYDPDQEVQKIEEEAAIPHSSICSLQNWASFG